MNGNIDYTEFMVANRAFTFDLLSEVPSSTDQKTWTVCNWDDYTSQQAQIEILNGLTVDGCTGVFKTRWKCNSGTFTIRAIGISLNGLGYLVTQPEDNGNLTVSEGSVFDVEITLVFNRWIQR